MHAESSPSFDTAPRLRRGAEHLPIFAREAGDTLRASWAKLRRHQPTIQNREAALTLGVSEGELVASACGEGVVRLRGSWGALLSELESLGPVVAITRNERCVHEKYGVYGNVRVLGPTGIVLNDAIDLRVFFDHWHHGFAVTDGHRQSLEIYDRDGTAVHKLILEPTSDRRAYADLVARYAADDQTPGLAVAPLAPALPEIPDAEIDVHAFRAGWGALEDTHDFVQLLRTFRVSRVQALRLAGQDFAHRVHRASVMPVLKTAAGDATPIMIFVGNPGTIQIHTGPIVRITTTPYWLNVRDPSFHLRLRTDRIASAWVVRKPTIDGTVTALELFDAQNGLVAQVFGARKPGQAEQGRWRTIVSRLGVGGR